MTERKVIFPEIKSFSELFESATQIAGLEGYKSKTVHEFKVDGDASLGYRSGTTGQWFAKIDTNTIPISDLKS